MKKLLIATKKSNIEKISVILGVSILLLITYRYAGAVLDYMFAVCGVITFIAMFYKQGITKDGLTILARGIETYKWSQIGYAEIEESVYIRITYFSTIGSPIIKHRYSKKNKEMLFKILGKNIKISGQI